MMANCKSLKIKVKVKVEVEVEVRFKIEWLEFCFLTSLLTLTLY